MLIPGIISYGISVFKKNKKAVLLTDLIWLESLERGRKSFGLEGVYYEYWCYPTTAFEGSFWIRSNKSVLLFLSDGFLKAATESQVMGMMEGLSATNFKNIRSENQKDSFRLILNALKGESRHYRYWVCSFFLYPVERLLRIARI